MSASITDKITDTRNAARPNSTTVSSGRSGGGATLACASLTGWPTASKVHFVTYKIDSSSAVVAGSQLDCYGIVSGNNITSFTVVDGTDTGNAIGDVVEMLPTAAWGQDLSDALLSQHTRTGAHGAVTATSVSNAGTLTQTGAATLASTLAVTGASTLTGAVGGTGYSSKTITNPCKFSVYRNAAYTIGGTAKIVFDTELFDSNSNFATGTYTVPVNGFYWFAWSAGAVFGGSGNSYNTLLYQNGSGVLAGTQALSTAAQTVVMGGSGLIQCTAGDTIEVWSTATAATGLTGASFAYFQGFIVSAT